MNKNKQMQNITTLLLEALDEAAHGLQADLSNEDRETINNIFDNILEALRLVLTSEEFKKLDHLSTPYILDEDE